MAIVETIKHEGPQDALVWRNTGKEYMMMGDEGINAGSQLIVDEFYEAVVFANGHALDSLPSGRHTLTTQNIPMLTNMYENMTTKNPFPCKIFFINKVHQFELQWGTSKISVDDPVYKIFLNVGCCGTMAIKIKNARFFLLEFVGNKETFTNEDFIAKMRGIISAKVKYYISNIMIRGRVSYFDMDANLYDISELVMDQLQKVFDEYGVEILFFNIETITVPDKDIQVLQEAKLRGAGRIADVGWEKERMFEVLQTAAANEGMSGTMMGAGMGLGMGAGIGMPMGQAMGSMTNNLFGSVGNPMDNNSPFGDGNGGGAPMPAPITTNSPENVGRNVNVNSFFHPQQAQQPQQAQGGSFCPNCGGAVPAGARFCSNCGNRMPEKSVCPNCGTEAAPGAKFCFNCGNQLG